MAETVVFIVAAALIAAGAIGVIIARNPVHSALWLVQALFGVALIFIDLDAHFLAAVQVIVYAGAIVILFLFVIMLLGVDRADDLEIDPIIGQRPIAVLVSAATLAALASVAITTRGSITGAISSLGPLDHVLDRTSAVTTPIPASDGKVLGTWLFTDYVFAFEITAVLLTIAVVGAVMLARKPSGPIEEPMQDEPMEATK